MMTGPIIPIFFGAWILLGVAGFWLFYVNRNVEFKRRYFPWYAGAGGVLFVGFGAATGKRGWWSLAKPGVQPKSGKSEPQPAIRYCWTIE